VPALRRRRGPAGARRLSGRGPHLGRALGLALVVLVADQLTKQLALAWIAPTEPIAVLPFLNLVLVWNRGVSFGLLGAHGLPAFAFVLVSLAIATGLLVWLWRERHAATALALGAIIGGAVGNVIDRLIHGAVVDFIDLHAAGYHWPAFNIADSAIVLGAAGLVLDGLLGRERAPDSGS
jgi:signal peptidase II